MTTIIRLNVTVIFSGDCDPNPAAAALALARAGYWVTGMPEKFRPELAHSRDDFMEVMKFTSSSDEAVLGREADEMCDEINTIVDHYGAMADNCGVVGADFVPFAFMDDPRLADELTRD